MQWGLWLCPSCHGPRMVETMPHPVELIVLQLPVRRWVLSVSERLRWYLERDPHAVTAVLDIFLTVIEANLRTTVSLASPGAKIGR